MHRITRILVTSLTLLAFASLAYAQPWYAKGSYYDGGAGTWGFNAGNELFDDGAHGDGGAGDGIYGGYVTSNQAAAKHEYKIANADWSVSFPGCNSWVHTTGSGDVIHFTFDTNTYADGWLPTTNILWSDHFAPAGTNFEVIGDAAETGSWVSGVAATPNGNVWELQVAIATPGSHEAKFRAVGTWDVCNVGSETNTPCGGNIPYTTTVADQQVKFQFDTTTGRARAEVITATPGANPMLIGLLALAMLGAGFVAIRGLRRAQA